MSAWRRLLLRIAGRFPVRVITGGGEDPYLEKYLVWESNETKDSWRLHIHRFVRSDADRELHSHPWRAAVSLILAGGYEEEHRVGASVIRRVVRPGMLNAIFADTFHRVDLLDGECWSLFLSGPVVQSWGFWSRATGAFTPWREFVASKGEKPAEGEYWRARKP